MLGPYAQKVGTRTLSGMQLVAHSACGTALQFDLAVVFQFCTSDSISSPSLFSCDNLLGLLINLLVLGTELRASCFMLNTCFITE